MSGRSVRLFSVDPVAGRLRQASWWVAASVSLRCILKLLPAQTLGEHLHPVMGRPTKELYSMAGLLFIMEFRDWTHEEAADAYMYNADLQYAAQTLSPRIKVFAGVRSNDTSRCFATMIWPRRSCTTSLRNSSKLLDLDVSKQRLDSTHIESNMAKFGRIRLMATAARRFLVQLKLARRTGLRSDPRVFGNDTKPRRTPSLDGKSSTMTT